MLDDLLAQLRCFSKKQSELLICQQSAIPCTYSSLTYFHK